MKINFNYLWILHGYVCGIHYNDAHTPLVHPFQNAMMYDWSILISIFCIIIILVYFGIMNIIHIWALLLLMNLITQEQYSLMNIGIVDELKNIIHSWTLFLLMNFIYIIICKPLFTWLLVYIALKVT